MKLTKRLKLLPMLILILFASLSNIRESKAEDLTCESLLTECAQVVELQQEALKEAQKEREIREVVISLQEKKIKELEAETKFTRKAKVWLLVGVAVFVLSGGTITF